MIGSGGGEIIIMVVQEKADIVTFERLSLCTCSQEKRVRWGIKKKWPN